MKSINGRSTRFRRVQKAKYVQNSWELRAIYVNRNHPLKSVKTKSVKPVVGRVGYWYVDVESCLTFGKWFRYVNSKS